MYCKYCGTDLPGDAVFCFKCGKPQKSQTDVSKPIFESQAPLDVFTNTAEVDAQAQAELGRKYCLGTEGVNKDETKARDHFEKAATRGNALGLWGLAWCYLNGLGGLPKDDTKALELCNKSVTMGSVEGMNLMGVMYSRGSGVAQNHIQAVAWYFKAAGLGYKAAQRNLGYAYYTGLGIAQNFNEAVSWYRKAAEQGDVQSRDNLEVILKHLQNRKPEYKRTCNHCGRVWFTDKEYEDRIIRNMKFHKGLLVFDILMAFSKNRSDISAAENRFQSQRLIEELNTVRACPNCRSSEYYEETA